MSPPSGDAPAAVIFGCAGSELSPGEAALFRDADPLGFILFGRNCQDPDQIRRLIEQLRATVGRDDAPVLVDQEGGPVQRLGPPQWEAVPAAAEIGALHANGPERAGHAAELAGRLIAAQLRPLGFSVTCAPVLDVTFAETDAVIGSRSYSSDPGVVSALARRFCDGLSAGGILPVIKHAPGHGRATVDSHVAVPRVAAAQDELRTIDFRPFKDLADMPLAMTAHVVYEAFDAANVATLSPTILGDVVRGEIGFEGFLMTDDIGMGALSGSFADRCAGALAAGCDAVLHCSGELDEMREVAAAVPRLTDVSAARWHAAAARTAGAEDNEPARVLAERLNALLAAA